MKTGPWTAEEDAVAMQYLNDHKTFLDISLLIDRPRNAIISRAARKGWNYPRKRLNAKNPVSAYVPPEPVKVKPLVSFTREKFIPVIKEPEPIEQPEIAGTVLLEKLTENQCRYVHGDPRGRQCCGKKTVTGKPWCPDHMQVVYHHYVKPSSNADVQVQ
jgi:hypothetical protein